MPRYSDHQILVFDDTIDMANSADPDQTAPKFTWVYNVCSGMSVQIFTVNKIPKNTHRAVNDAYTKLIL